MRAREWASEGWQVTDEALGPGVYADLVRSAATDAAALEAAQ